MVAILKVKASLEGKPLVLFKEDGQQKAFEDLMENFISENPNSNTLTSVFLCFIWTSLGLKKNFSFRNFEWKCLHKDCIWSPVGSILSRISSMKFSFKDPKSPIKKGDEITFKDLFNQSKRADLAWRKTMGQYDKK